MKKLIVFIESYVGGGSDRHLVDMVNILYDAFDDIAIVSNPPGLLPGDLKRLKRNISTVQVQIISMPRIFYSFRKLPPRSIRIAIRGLLLPFQPIIFLYNFILSLYWLKVLKPTTVLCCNGGYPAAQMTLLMVITAKMIGIKTVLSIVSMPSSRRRLFMIYEWLMDKLVWSNSDTIIVNAQAIASALQILRGMPENKAYVIYNAIEDRQLLKRDEKGLTDQCRIGFLSRMEHEKGCLYLMHAFIALVKKYPQLRMILVGKGTATEQLAKLVEDHGLEEQVEITGYYDGDVHELLSSFDIYAFPSLYEGLPYSVLEAMRAGCAIVSTNVGGIPEVIRDQVDGLLVNPGGVEELGTAIERLIRDVSLRIKLGEKARDRFLEMFTLDKMNKKIRETFLLNGHI